MESLSFVSVRARMEAHTLASLHVAECTRPVSMTVLEGADTVLLVDGLSRCAWLCCVQTAATQRLDWFLCSQLAVPVKLDRLLNRPADRVSILL